MFTSRRSMLAAAGALGSFNAASAAVAAHEAEASRRVAADLAALSERANDALMRGDIARYRELVTLAPDFLLMSPFGGTPTHGSQVTPERLEAMGRFFRNGSLTHEVVQSWAGADMVALAVIERATHVAVGGLPAQDWALRVTLVYRRDGSAWQLVHRHADPLVAGIHLTHSAELARGEAECASAASPAVPGRGAP